MIGLRPFMWVRYQGRIGILVSIDPKFMLGEVHIVKPDGTTLVRLQDVYLPHLQQASYSDIPESRRPSEVSARLLGYV